MPCVFRRVPSRSEALCACVRHSYFTLTRPLSPFDVRTLLPASKPPPLLASASCLGQPGLAAALRPQGRSYSGSPALNGLPLGLLAVGPRPASVLPRRRRGGDAPHFSASPPCSRPCCAGGLWAGIRARPKCPPTGRPAPARAPFPAPGRSRSLDGRPRPARPASPRCPRHPAATCR